MINFVIMFDKQACICKICKYGKYVNTLYNVCAVPWGVLSTVGVFSTVGDIMSTVGEYLEYRGGVQYRGGYHDKCGGYLEYRGGYHEYRGGYLEYRGGCSVPWGIS